MFILLSPVVYYVLQSNTDRVCPLTNLSGIHTVQIGSFLSQKWLPNTAPRTRRPLLFIRRIVHNTTTADRPLAEVTFENVGIHSFSTKITARVGTSLTYSVVPVSSLRLHVSFFFLNTELVQVFQTTERLQS